MEGFRNIKIKTEKPDWPKFQPLTNTSRGIEPKVLELFIHGKLK
jgi:hypothetical protein